MVGTALLLVLFLAVLLHYGAFGARWRGIVGRAVRPALILGALVPVGVTVLLRASGHATIEPGGVAGADLLQTTLPMVAATILLSSWEEIAYRGYLSNSSTKSAVAGSGPWRPGYASGCRMPAIPARTRLAWPTPP